MKPRKTHRHLPAKMHLKHGAYYYIDRNKWHPLGKDLPQAMAEYTRRITGRIGTMPALIDKVLAHISPTLAANTVKQYAIAATALKQYFAEFAPEQVKPKHVAAVKADTAHKPNMGNRYLSFLRIVFAHAVEWQIVDSNPCIGIKRHSEKSRQRYLTDAEYNAIWLSASDNLKAIIDIAYLTGQRIGDVLAIKLSDIHPGGIDFHQQKTGEKVTVKMTPALDAAIQAARQLKRPARALTLFCTMRGARPYAYRTVRDMFANAARKAAIADVRLHDLRAKALTDADLEGKDAQTLGGHTNRQQTERYIRRRKGKLADSPELPRTRSKTKTQR